MDKSFLSSWNFWSILFCFIFFFFFFQWETYGFCITEVFFGLRIKYGVTEGSSCESLWSFLRKPLVIPAKAFGHSCESRNQYQSSAKSFQSGFMNSINSIFHCRFHFFIRFSLVIASNGFLKIS